MTVSTEKDSTQVADQSAGHHSGQRRLKVLSLLNKLVWAGHEQRLLQLVTSIDRTRFDHQLLVITAPQFADEEQERATGSMRHAFAEAGYPVHDLGEPNDPEVGRVGWRRAVFGSKGMLRVVRKLVRYIRQHRIDVIDTHHTTAIFAAAIAGRITGVPVIISAYHVEPWKPVVMRLPGQFAFGTAASIVTDSQARADDIRNFLWKKSAQIEVIPTGVPVPHPTRSKAEVLRGLELNCGDDVRIVGQVSGRIPFKGHDVLIEAIPQILSQHPDARFLCIGYSRSYHDYESQLERRIQELGLSDRVFFRAYPGPIGDVWQVFDMLVHPSKFDSLPLSILEAMAIGKPIVSTSVGGIPEVITHQRNGLLVPPSDSAALAASVSQLLSDPAEARRLGDAARRDYEASLTPAVMARSLERVYEAAVRQWR